MSVIDIIGYLASIVVLISFLTTSVIKLRIINFGGCLLFVIYGLLIRAYPVALINAGISCVQIYFLYKMLKSKSDYRMVRCLRNDMFLNDFITHHNADIKNFLPSFNFETLPLDSICYFCMVNEELAGIWIGVRSKNSVIIAVDYVKDKFRDCGMGKYIYKNSIGLFKNDGISSLEISNISEKHAEYLAKVGFTKSPGKGKFILNIA